MKLIKVAKDLNVGFQRVVEFLHSKGYEIEGKPMAQLSPDMVSALEKEFCLLAANQDGCRQDQSPL